MSWTPQRSIAGTSRGTGVRLLAIVLAATAAFVVSATSAVTGASADYYCHTSASPCVEGFLPETTFATHAKSALLKSTGLEVKCESTMEGESTADLEEGKGITGKVTALTFSGCSGTCSSAKANNLPYTTLDIANEKGGGGTATITSGGSGKPGITLSSCTGLKEPCVYGASEVTLTFEGGNGGSEEKDGRFLAKEAKLSKVSGAGCPETATWTGTYVETVVGAEFNGDWWWSRSRPIISWNSYDYGEVTVNNTATSIGTYTSSAEVEWGQVGFSGNGEGIFAIVVDNCSNQKILGNCTMETTCKPKATVTYEATREISWKKVGGGGEGTIKTRLKCKGK